MTQKVLKQVLKEHGYSIVPHSMYRGENKDVFLFNAYDNSGNCWKFWVDPKCQYANKQYLSDCIICKHDLISAWFF